MNPMKFLSARKSFKKKRKELPIFNKFPKPTTLTKAVGDFTGWVQ